MTEDEAADGLELFFADGFRPLSFIGKGPMAGWWFHDIHGPRKRASDEEIGDLLYLLGCYLNGE